MNKTAVSVLVLAVIALATAAPTRASARRAILSTIQDVDRRAECNTHKDCGACAGDDSCAWQLGGCVDAGSLKASLVQHSFEGAASKCTYVKADECSKKCDVIAEKFTPTGTTEFTYERHHAELASDVAADKDGAGEFNSSYVSVVVGDAEGLGMGGIVLQGEFNVKAADSDIHMGGYVATNAATYKELAANKGYDGTAAKTVTDSAKSLGTVAVSGAPTAAAKTGYSATLTSETNYKATCSWTHEGTNVDCAYTFDGAAPAADTGIAFQGFSFAASTVGGAANEGEFTFDIPAKGKVSSAANAAEFDVLKSAEADTKIKINEKDVTVKSQWLTMKAAATNFVYTVGSDADPKKAPGAPQPKPADSPAAMTSAMAVVAAAVALLAFVA